MNPETHTLSGSEAALLISARGYPSVGGASGRLLWRAPGCVQPECTIRASRVTWERLRGRHLGERAAEGMSNRARMGGSGELASQRRGPTGRGQGLAPFLFLFSLSVPPSLSFTVCVCVRALLS